MIIFNILTLFPKSFISLKETGLLGKAYKNKIFDVNIINIRDYSNLSANSVDDKLELVNEKMDEIKKEMATKATN